MVLWVLDTDHISLFQSEHPLVVQNMGRKSPDQVATTIVTDEEQVRGWLAVLRRSRTQDELVKGYRKLAVVRSFFSAMQVLDFTDRAAEQYVELLGQKLKVGTLDLRIAAIVLSVDGTLVTRNRQDFAKVPELRIEDWSSGKI